MEYQYQHNPGRLSLSAAARSLLQAFGNTVQGNLLTSDALRPSFPHDPLSAPITVRATCQMKIEFSNGAAGCAEEWFIRPIRFHTDEIRRKSWITKRTVKQSLGSMVTLKDLGRLRGPKVIMTAGLPKCRYKILVVDTFVLTQNWWR